MKPTTMLATMALLLGSLTQGFAETKLLWRTPTSGVTIVPNSKGTLVSLGTVDISAYDRFRLVVIARRPSNIPAGSSFGAPFQIELHIGEGTSDLGVLENAVFPLNPTSTNTTVPAHTERVTAVFDNPVITTLLVDAVGPTTGNQQTVVDLFIYGQKSTTTSP
jgi:hypothetical protein